MCTGSNPDEGHLNHLEPRKNYPLIFVFIVSILINVAVPLRIRYYQLKRKKKEQGRYFSLNLTDLTTNVAIITALFSMLIGMIIQFKVIPANINKYPHYITTYLIQLIIPKVGILIVMIIYYFRNASLRSTIWRAIKEDVLHWS